MTVLTDVRCNERYYPNYNMNTQVCAGENDVSTGACQGDSGGPLVMQNPKDGKWYLIGIISWGFSCGMGTVFARGLILILLYMLTKIIKGIFIIYLVKPYLNWINSKIALG